MRPDDDLRQPRWLTLAWIALAVAAVSTLWIVEYLPTNDGPNHILLGWLSAHFADPGRGYADFLRPARPVTNLGFQLLFAGFERILPWKHALRVVLSIGVLLWGSGFAALALAIRRDRAPLVAAGFATALSWNLYMGFFSYWLAQGLALWLLALALRRADWGTRELCAISAGLLGIALCHSFAAAIVGVLLLGVAAARPAAKGRLRALAGLAAAGAPALVVAWLSARGAAEDWEVNNPKADALAAVWTGADDRIGTLWRCFAGGPAWRGLVPLALALTGLVVTAVRARRRDDRVSAQEIGLAAASALLLLVALLSPADLNVWQALSARFLPLPLAVGMALVPIEALPPPRWRAAAAGMVAFALAAVGWSASHHRALAAAAADALEIAKQPLPRHGPRLPLVLVPEDSAVALATPHANMGHIFALEQGGMTPYLFATRPTLHAFVYQRARRQLFPAFPPRFQFITYQAAGSAPDVPPREAQLAWMAMLGSAYEDVILWSSPEDADALVARGYRADARKGGAAVLRYEACGLEVNVEAGEALADPLLVQYGWQPLDEKAEMAEFPPGAKFPGGIAHASFAKAPCGPLWVRVAWDRDRSGKAGPRDVFCEGADARGKVAFASTREAHTVQCRPAAGPAAPSPAANPPPQAPE